MAAGPSGGLQSPSDTPTGGPDPGPGPATLAGMTPGGQGEPPSPQGGGAGGGMTKMLGTAMQTLKQSEMMMTQMARQFPAASPSLLSAQEGIRQAVKGIQAALGQIMTSPGQPEPPAPAIGG